MNPYEDWDALHRPAQPQDAVEVARLRNAQLRAASRLAELCSSLPRLTVPLTRHFDYDRLRVNVYHLIAPDLIQWR